MTQKEHGERRRESIHTGTYELTGISGALTGGAGLSPRDLTVFNGEGLFPQVLFVGNDASGQIGLWVTDGFDSVAAAARARRTARSLATVPPHLDVKFVLPKARIG
jgi:hypothetical protein